MARSVWGGWKLIMSNASPALGAHEIPFRRQVALPVLYWNKRIDVDYRMDLVAGGLSRGG